jgi:hypothetical protein
MTAVHINPDNRFVGSRVCCVCGGKLSYGKVHYRCRKNLKEGDKGVGAGGQLCQWMEDHVHLDKQEVHWRSVVVGKVKHWNKRMGGTVLNEMFPDMADREFGGSDEDK